MRDEVNAARDLSETTEDCCRWGNEPVQPGLLVFQKNGKLDFSLEISLLPIAR